MVKSKFCTGIPELGLAKLKYHTNGLPDPAAAESHVAGNLTANLSTPLIVKSTELVVAPGVLSPPIATPIKERAIVSEVALAVYDL
tara:strand:+ start:1304 stop:1561 length:258 start_codon:yes stop_codon:yes gene_type:complete